MGKYFCMQMKRLRRVVLPVIMIATVLFGCLLTAYYTAKKFDEASQVKTKFKVGIVGTADEMYLSMALQAAESMDSSRFSIQFMEMEQTDAQEALRQGDISAFVVFPEGFLDAAFHGNIIPLKFVCTDGAADLISMIKNEFTQMIEIMVTEAQRGIYGLRDVLVSHNLSTRDVVNNISIEYAEMVFERGNIYRVNTQQSFEGLGMEGYLITGIAIVLFLLICLIFSTVMVRGDYALCRMLCAQKQGVVRQVLCDFGAYMLALTVVAGVLFVCLVLVLQVSLTGMMLLKALPAVLALGAMSFFLYELSSNLISGVLLQFLVSMAMCFISGCMYPITFFPETVQKMAAFLPAGIAREQIAHCIQDTHNWTLTGALLGYMLVFVLCAMMIRRVRTARG